MAQQQDTISHFSHAGHELVKRHYTGPFRCDMCWEALSGSAYGCLAGCDFAIHDTCAGHPQTHYHPSHPQHSLVLVQTRRDVAHTCDVCAGHAATGGGRDNGHAGARHDGHGNQQADAEQIQAALLFEQGSQRRVETPRWTC